MLNEKEKRGNEMTATSIYSTALESFINSGEFAEAVVKSTKAGFGGSSYSVELFDNGTWRVLWANQIGNRYESVGTIERIPALSDSDYQDFEEMAGSDEVEAIASQLRGTDELEGIAQEMRDNL